jgi:hypothetical protein
MFVDELRHAIEAAPRCRLSEVAKVLWKAVAVGQINEIDAEQLSNLLDARRALPAPAPARRSRGTRPRTPASIERRRRWAASGTMPVGLAARFSIAEQAALAVVAGEVVKHGCCTLYVGHIAALAGVSETSVRNALREARQLGLVAVDVRRVAAWRNDSNVVTITSPVWLNWLARGGRQGGCRSVQGTISRVRTGSADRLRPHLEITAGATLDQKSYREGGRPHRPASSWMASEMRRDGRTGRSDAGRMFSTVDPLPPAGGAPEAKFGC